MEQNLEPPLAEGPVTRDLWGVAYQATADAVDVLLFRFRRRGDAVDLGPCLFAGRLRGETWVSTVGEVSPRALQALTAWATLARR